MAGAIRSFGLIICDVFAAIKAGHFFYDHENSFIGYLRFWLNLRISRDFFLGRNRNRALTLFFEVENMTSYKSAAIVNPVTGKGYEYGDPVPLEWRDPNYPDPQDRGMSPANPARYLAPAQIWFGGSLKF